MAEYRNTCQWKRAAFLALLQRDPARFASPPAAERLTPTWPTTT